jgi:hypothetical protein
MIYGTITLSATVLGLRWKKVFKELLPVNKMLFQAWDRTLPSLFLCWITKLWCVCSCIWVTMDVIVVCRLLLLGLPTSLSLVTAPPVCRLSKSDNRPEGLCILAGLQIEMRQASSDYNYAWVLNWHSHFHNITQLKTVGRSVTITRVEGFCYVT